MSIKPHTYTPDPQAMGDCRICGHTQNRPWHISALPDGEAVAWREKLVHAICPHIKQWSDAEDVPKRSCQKCPAKVQTSHGEGVQMCRLNAERAADDILALYASPPPASAGVREWRDNLYKDGKTPDRKAIDDAADEHRQQAIRALASGEKSKA